VALIWVQAVVDFSSPTAGEWQSGEIDEIDDSFATQLITAGYLIPYTGPLPPSDGAHISGYTANIDARLDLLDTAVAGLGTTVSAHTAAVDPHGYAPTALRTWYAALANRHYAPAKIVTLGGSTSEGYGSTVHSRQLYQQLAARLRGRYPVAGAVGGPGLIPPVTLTAGMTYPAVLSGGAAASVAYGGWVYRSTTIQTSTGQAITYTVTCSDFEIIFSRYTGFGHFTYSIDGGGTVDVNTSGATSRWVSTGVISAGSSGAHTIVIAWASTNPVIIRGLIAHDGDSAAGIQIYDGGHSGYTSTQYVAMTDTAGGITAIQPHLVFVDLGRNDYGASPQVAPATMRTNIESLLTLIRGACSTSPSFVLYVSQQLGGTITPTPTYSWSDYRAAYAAIAAAATDVSIFDLSTRQVAPLVSNALGLYNGDWAHLSDKGHSAVADVLAQFLSPR